MNMTTALAKQLQLHQTTEATATTNNNNKAMLYWQQQQQQQQQHQEQNTISISISQNRKITSYNNSNSNSNNSNISNGKQQQNVHSQKHLTASICKDGLRRRRQNANCSHFNLSNNGLLQQTGVTQSSTLSASSSAASSSFYSSSCTSPISMLYATYKLYAMLFCSTILRTTTTTTTSSSSSSSSSSNRTQPQQCCYRQKLKKFWHFDLMGIVALMLAVAAIMISNHAVAAAQRESLKDKDPFSANMNANVIPNRYNTVNTNNNNNNNNNNINVIHTNGTQTHGMPTTSERKKLNVDEITTRSSKNLDGFGASTTNEQTETTGTMQKATLANGPSTMSTPLTKYGTITPSQSSSSFKKFSINSVTTGGHRNSIESTDESRNGPYFDKTVSKNVTALLGKTAYLNCRVKNLGNKTMLLQVSWVRHRDIHLLTVGRYTYTSDQRFRAIHQPQTEDWILQIKYPQHRDSGIYECQVSTTPHMSHYIHLNVVEPSTEIVGAPDLYIENGSTINLTCVIFNSPEPPAYIFWNHNDAIINYDSPRGGVSVVTIKGETTTSFLLIKSARPSDSGLYQCNPSNARAKMVTVHVLNGEFPAAMQRAGQAYHHMSRNHYLLVYLLIYLFTLVYVKHYIQPPVVVGATVMSMPFLTTNN